MYLNIVMEYANEVSKKNKQTDRYLLSTTYKRYSKQTGKYLL